MTDNQYYSEEHPPNQLQYSIPDPNYYRPQPRRPHTHTDSCSKPAGYYPPPQTQQTFNTGSYMVEENMHICTGVDSLERRLAQQKVERQGKGDKTLKSILES